MIVHSVCYCFRIMKHEMLYTLYFYSDIKTHISLKRTHKNDFRITRGDFLVIHEKLMNNNQMKFFVFLIILIRVINDCKITNDNSITKHHFQLK